MMAVTRFTVRQAGALKQLNVTINCPHGEMVNTGDLKSLAAKLTGSSPVVGTNKMRKGRQIKCKYCKWCCVSRSVETAYQELYVHAIVEHWDKLPQELIESWKKENDDIMENRK